MKSIHITGCSRGIALETAPAFGRAGYKLFAKMRNFQSVDTLQQMSQSKSLDIATYKMGVNSNESVSGGIKTLYKQRSGK